MPNRSKAEWCALDERLAREVRGWCLWDDIPQAEGDALVSLRLRSTPPEILRAFALESVRAFWWQKHPEHGWIHAYARRDWRPHNAVAQALEVADAVIAKDPDLRYTLDCTSSEYVCTFWKLYAWCGHRDRGSASVLCRAICLAVEQWANAQGEQRDAR